MALGPRQLEEGRKEGRSWVEGYLISRKKNGSRAASISASINSEGTIDLESARRTNFLELSVQSLHQLLQQLQIIEIL